MWVLWSTSTSNIWIQKHLQRWNERPRLGLELLPQQCRSIPCKRAVPGSTALCTPQDLVRPSISWAVLEEVQLLTLCPAIMLCREAALGIKKSIQQPVLVWKRDLYRRKWEVCRVQIQMQVQIQLTALIQVFMCTSTKRHPEFHCSDIMIMLGQHYTQIILADTPAKGGFTLTPSPLPSAETTTTQILAGIPRQGDAAIRGNLRRHHKILWRLATSYRAITVGTQAARAPQPGSEGAVAITSSRTRQPGSRGKQTVLLPAAVLWEVKFLLVFIQGKIQQLLFCFWHTIKKREMVLDRIFGWGHIKGTVWLLDPLEKFLGSANTIMCWDGEKKEQHTGLRSAKPFSASSVLLQCQGLHLAHIKFICMFSTSVMRADYSSSLAPEMEGAVLPLNLSLPRFMDLLASTPFLHMLSLGSHIYDTQLWTKQLGGRCDFRSRLSWGSTSTSNAPSFTKRKDILSPALNTPPSMCSLKKADIQYADPMFSTRLPSDKHTNAFCWAFSLLTFLNRNRRKQNLMQ